MNDLYQSFLIPPVITQNGNNLNFSYPIRSTKEQELHRCQTIFLNIAQYFPFIHTQEFTPFLSNIGESIQVRVILNEADQSGIDALISNLQANFSYPPEIRENGNSLDFSINSGENPNLILLNSLEKFESLHQKYDIIKFFTGCSSSLEKAFLEMAELFNDIEQQ